jgi:tetratricopeptide (TPR) repeat protein
VKLYEKETGSVLRAMDFVFKTGTGAIRPLLPNEDRPNDNLYKTFYRDQISKVAIAIKEIVLGMKAEPVMKVEEKDHGQVKESLKKAGTEEPKELNEKPALVGRTRFLIPIIVVALLIIAGIFAYPKIFKRNTLERLRTSGERISVAVMPFQNMTNDTTWNVWQDGIQYNLINYLSNFPEDLQVRQTESINNLLDSKGLTNYASITPSFARKISQTLNADIFIQGNIVKSGNVIRLSARLIDTKTEEIIKPFQIEGPSNEENFLPKIDSLSGMVKDFLIISKLKKEQPTELQRLASTNSPEAYRFYAEGGKAFVKFDYTTAIKLFSQAVAADSNFIWATLNMAQAYNNRGLYDQAKELFLKVYKKRDQMPEYDKMWIDYYHAYWFEMPSEVIKCLKQLLELDDQSPTTYWLIGDQYSKSYQFDKAVPEFEKCLGVYDKWGVKPFWVPVYTALGSAYHEIGEFKKEKRLYKKAEKDFPDASGIIYRQAVLALTDRNTKDANEYIDKYTSYLKEQSSSEANIANALGNIYSNADNLNKAEEYYRKALSLEPENLGRLNVLSYFLIDKDRNYAEGLDLIEKCLAKRPEQYNYLHCKGWGLYKQGKYEEALQLIQKAWDLSPTKIFSMHIYYHLEASKKAVAGMK